MELEGLPVLRWRRGWLGRSRHLCPFCELWVLREETAQELCFWHDGEPCRSFLEASARPGVKLLARTYLRPFAPSRPDVAPLSFAVGVESWRELDKCSP